MLVIALMIDDDRKASFCQQCANVVPEEAILGFHTET